MKAIPPLSRAGLAPALALLAGAALPAAAQPAGPSALDCMIQPNQVVLVGTPSPGVIERVLVDRGDLVRPGQPVVQMVASVERAALALARERAAQVGELNVASSSSELARRELQRASELVEMNFVSETFADKARAESRAASGRIEQAQERRQVARREVDLAAAQLEQRTIRTPIAGVVVERLGAPGEFVDQKPMLRLAELNPLRVDVLVPAVAFGRVAAGMRGEVVPETLDRKARQAVVKTVDRVIDAASNTFRVRLELPNPDHALPAGLRCQVRIEGLVLPAAPGTVAAAFTADAKAGGQSRRPVSSTH